MKKKLRCPSDEVGKQDFTQNIVDLNGNLLKAVLPKIDSDIVNFDNYIKEITPYTGLTQSELFTGSNAGVSLLTSSIFQTKKTKHLI